MYPQAIGIGSPQRTSSTHGKIGRGIPLFATEEVFWGGREREKDHSYLLGK